MAIQCRPPPTSLHASTEAESEVIQFTPTSGFGRKLYLIKSCQILTKITGILFRNVSFLYFRQIWLKIEELFEK